MEFSRESHAQMKLVLGDILARVLYQHKRRNVPADTFLAGTSISERRYFETTVELSNATAWITIYWSEMKRNRKKSIHSLIIQCDVNGGSVIIRDSTVWTVKDQYKGNIAVLYDGHVLNPDDLLYLKKLPTDLLVVPGWDIIPIADTQFPAERRKEKREI